MLFFIYFIFFLNFLFLHYTLELFILLVYSFFIYTMLYYFSNYFLEIEFFDLVSKEDEVVFYFLLLSILYFNLLKIRLFIKTNAFIKFVNFLISSICNILKNNLFLKKFIFLHMIYKIDDINNCIDSLFSFYNEDNTKYNFF